MVYDTIGLVGVVAIIIAYFLLQADRVRYDDYSYLFLNGAGATLILISLIYAFNLAAFVMEAIWVAISLYGAIKRWTREHSGTPG
jgi:predicted membrane protein